MSDSGVDVTAQFESGTDFSAGFMLANEMLNSEKVSDNGHKKVVILISDGEPTCYTDVDGNSVEYIPYELEEDLVVPTISEEVIDEVSETTETEAIISETIESEVVLEEIEETELEVTESVDIEVVETEATETEVVETEVVETEVVETEAEVVEVEITDVEIVVVEETEATEAEVTETTEDVLETIQVESDVCVESEAVVEENEDVPEVYFSPAPSMDLESYQNACDEATLMAFEKLLENNEDLLVYSIGLGEELKPTSLAKNADEYVITSVISESCEYVYIENDALELKACLYDIIEKDIPNNVVLTAELSKYVEILPLGLSDIRVTMTTTDGRIVMLYDEKTGGITEDGMGVIDSIIIAEPLTDSVDSTGAVYLYFKPEYVLAKGNTYTLSFNVCITTDAIDTYFTDGYVNKGDKDTDYVPGTDLSSGQDGFFVNKVAYITYDLNGERVGYDPSTNSENIFNRPVAQVDIAIPSYESSFDYSAAPMPMALASTPSGDSNVDFTKTIDSLGDGPNDDTDLVGNEFYRLYLDIEGIKSETKTPPVDLLIIVDQSGSMFDNADVTYNGKTGLYRDIVISTILNGQAELLGGSRTKPSGTQQFKDNYDSTYKINSSVTSDSLINQFLAINPENKVAVIGFDAWRDPNDDASRVYDATVATDNYNYTFDARQILGWTTNKISGDGVDVTGKFNTGTNYDASFRLAYDMFTSDAVKNDGHEKVMIFISDGVPTCYIASNGDRAGSTFSTVDNQPAHDNIVNVCRQPSLNAFNNLIYRLNSQGIVIDAYSVGISSELNSNNPDDHAYSNYVIRQCIAGNGIYVFAENGDELDQQLHHIINAKFPSQVVITDKLSQYVEFYSTNPDVKVIMTDDKGVEYILYDSNQGGVTSLGGGIIDNVKYSPATVKDGTTTGTVTATFDPAYALKENYIYSLSYNVKVTDVAYNEFANGGYVNTGNGGTDYPNNNTSSGNLGFNSNKEATVDYFLECKKEEGIYQHPVVQVEEEKILTNVTVVKNWKDDNGPISPVEPVEVQLYQIATPVDGGTDITNLYPGSTYTAEVYPPLIIEDFNDETLANNVTTNGISYEIVDSNNDGDGEAHVLSGRSYGYNSFYIDLNDYKGQTIKIDTSIKSGSGTAYVTFKYRPSGATQDKYINAQGNDSNYPNPVRLTNCSSQFKSGSATITIPADATNCQLYIETGNDDTSEFWVDYFNVTKSVPVTHTYTPAHSSVVTDSVIFENFENGSSSHGNRGDYTPVPSVEDANKANEVLGITNRRNSNGLQDWIGIQFDANKFIGKTIYADARAMCTGTNGERVELGVQYNVPGEDKAQYKSLLDIAGSNGKYASGTGSFDIPPDATNVYVFVQTTQNKNTAPDFYIDYVYIWSDTLSPDGPKTIPYRDPIMLSTSNENRYVFEDLPSWGLDSNGFKVDYSYYVVENTAGKDYTVTYSNDSNNPVVDGTITVTNKIDGVYGYELPNTGGIGTGFNYLIGLILMCIPGGFYIKRIRKRSVRDP